MCDFCENIEEYGIKEPYLDIDGELLYNSKENKYYIVLNDAWNDYFYEKEVEFCPMCGRKLSEETEKPNLRDKIIEKIKYTDPDYINYSDFYTKYGTLIPGIGNRWHWFENLTDKAKREGLVQISDMSEAELFDLYVQINEDWKKTRSRQFWEMYDEKCELEKRIKKL